MNIKKHAFLVIYRIMLAAALIFAAGSILLALLAVPGNESRYVLEHSRLTKIGNVRYAGLLTDAGAVSPGDASDADVQEFYAEPVHKQEHREDTFSERLDDVNMMLATVLPNIFTRCKGVIRVEAGNVLDAGTLSEAAGQEVIPVTELSSIPTDDIGYYRVSLKIKNKLRSCIIIITDSQAPYISVERKTLWVGDDPVPEDFVSEASDGTELEFYYVTSPSCVSGGTTSFTIAATDRAGNTTAADVVCEVYEDTEPPVITGARDRHYYIGEDVLYKDGVTVEDNRDGSDVRLDIDISAVDPKTEGKYPVIYTATDSTGLTTVIEATFTFEYTKEDALHHQIDQLTQPIIDKIIKDGMTEREKAKAIYNWVRNSIGYVGYSDKSNLYQGALDGLRTRRGDCFTYAAVSKVLLTAAGIENVDIERKYSPRRPNGHHYWNMVKIDGNWYHFDTTPRVDHATFFLLTTDQLLKFSRNHYDSHLFDPEEYPKTP